MDISVPDFVRRIEHNSQPSALLIGFDGSAALLNHLSVTDLYEELVGTLPTDNDIQWGQMAAAWQSTDRLDFMTRHTRPADPNGPDKRAIDCIASMVLKDRIRAIVCTDTAGVLFKEITARGVDMERYSCADNFPEFLSAVKDGRVFVDGVFLQALRPNFLAKDKTGVFAIEEALRKFLESFNYIYCWGWSKYNVSFDKFCCIDSDHQYIAIGRRTATEMRLDEIDTVTLESDRHSTNQPGQGGRFGVTNEIFYELGDRLYPHSDEPNAGAKHHGPTAAAGDTQAELPHLLLTEDTTADIADNANRATVSFIGVEGDLVRHRCARWLAATWRAEGRRCVSYEGSDAAALARYVTMTTASPDSMLNVVGMLGNGTGDWAYLSTVLLPQALRWRDHAPSGKPGNYHVALFVPTYISEWALNTFEGNLSFWALTLFDDNFLVSRVLGKWLDQHIPPLIGRDLEPNTREALVRQMLGSTENGRQPGRADWLHEALDFWYREIQHEDPRLAGPADADPSPAGPGLGMEDLFAAWGRVCANYEEAERNPAVDFEVLPVQSHKKGPTGSDDDAAPPDGDDDAAPPGGTASDSGGASPPGESAEFTVRPTKKKRKLPPEEEAS